MHPSEELKPLPRSAVVTSSTQSRQRSRSLLGTSPASANEPVWKLSAATSATRSQCTQTVGTSAIGPGKSRSPHEEGRREQGYLALKCDPVARYEYSLTDNMIDEVAEPLEAVREAVG